MNMILHRVSIIFTLLILFTTGTIIKAQNPSLLADLRPGTGSSKPLEFAKAGNITLFTAWDSADGVAHLFRTDGTPGGTYRLILTSPGFVTTTADHLTTLGSEVYFVGDNQSGYCEIWRTDGTQAGTVGLEGYTNSGGLLNSIGIMDDYLYFTVHNNDTIQLRKIKAGMNKSSMVHSFGIDHGGNYDCFSLVGVNHQLYFDYYSQFDLTDQIWVSNGTDTGTQMLQHLDAWALESQLMVSGKCFYYLVTANNMELLYIINSNDNVPTLLSYTTTTGNSYPAHISLSTDGFEDHRLMFSFNDGIHGNEPWITDGTQAGTHLFVDIATGSASSNPYYYTRFGDKIIFPAEEPVFGRELWYTSITDNTMCTLFQDLYPGATGSTPAELTTVGNRLFFCATSPIRGRELFTADTSAGSITMVADINPGTADGSPYRFSNTGYPLYFCATNAATGTELYMLNDLQKVFTGTINNAWSNPANWSPYGVPGPKDNVMIPYAFKTMDTQPFVILDVNDTVNEAWLNGGRLNVLSGANLVILSGPKYPATINTGNAITITSSAITLSGNSVTDDGGATVFERGIVWGSQTNPEISGPGKINSGAGIGSFILNAAALSAGTTYHFRAYAINSAGVSYGNDLQVTTLP